MGWIGVIIVFIIGIMGIVLLSGHGGFLIAGYNTASEEEKAMYDEKKLCRIMGIGFLIVEIGLLGLVLSDKLSFIYVVFIFAGIAIPVFFSNKYALKKDAKAHAGKKKNKSDILGIVIFCITLLFVGVMMFAGDIKVEFHDNDMECSGFLTGSSSIAYDDVESVSLEKDLDIGKRTAGVGSLSINAGNFKNEKFGPYKLYSYTSCDTYVVIDTEKKTIVVNDKDEASTTALYQTLLKHVEDK